MSAELLPRERVIVAEDAFVEIRIRRVPSPVRGSRHAFKYALAYFVRRECVLRYDNKAGKGDHRHLGAVETPNTFTTPEHLLADFWEDVETWTRRTTP